MSKPVVTIVAAALKHGALTLSAPPPARHHTLLRAAAGAGLPLIGPDYQGFITSAGTYVDRREAAQIAIDAGQTNEATMHNRHMLFSEDLW